MGAFTKIFLLSEQQMNEYKHYYDYSFEVFNATGQVSTVSPLSTAVNPFPFYKHYFDEIRVRNSSNSFCKNLKHLTHKDKNSKGSLCKI
jgi:hypothetical protein